MRISAGKLKGRNILAPEGREVRPTSAKVRESIFDSLQAQVGGSRVLDLFAGSGAVGIEAYSRGAGEALGDEGGVLPRARLPAGETEWCATLPRVWRDRDEETLRSWLDRAKGLGVTAALLGNIGHIPLTQGLGLNLYGDFGLNVFNSRSLEYLRDKGLQSACVSFELRFSQIRDLAKCLPAEAIVYGRLPLMITEHDLTAGGVTALRDRTGAEFPLLSAFGRRTEILNSRPLWLADRSDWQRLGLRYARLRFTTETPADCVRVFRDYLTGAAPEGVFTRGLYERGVE